MPRFLSAVPKFKGLLSLALAVVAAFVFRSGYEELAAVIWLLALIPV